MIDAFYAVVIIGFASACVLTLFSYLIRGNEIREEISEMRRNLDGVKERTAEIQEELEGLRFDSRLLDDERVALETQGKCMVDLLETHQKRREEAENQR